MSMEVKIKDGDMLIDATVEVENGVMLITPKAPLSKREVKWTPKDGERFYYPSFSGGKFYARVGIENKIMPVTEWEEYEKGWIFRKAEECRPLCDKMNAAILIVTR